MAKTKCSYYYFYHFYIDPIKIKSVVDRFKKDAGYNEINFDNLTLPSYFVLPKTEYYFKKSLDHSEELIQLQKNGLGSFINIIRENKDYASNSNFTKIIEMSNRFESDLPATLESDNVFKQFSEFEGFLRNTIKLDELGTLSLNVKKHPYVLTVLEFERSIDYHKFVVKPLQNLVYKDLGNLQGLSSFHIKKLSSLLYRFSIPEDWENVDLSYVLSSPINKNFLTNFHLHKDIYINVHSRSTLMFINGGNPKIQDLKIAYKQLLVDTIADVRSRLFGFVIINHLIDRFVDDMLRGYKPKLILEGLINFRKFLISQLDTSVTQKHTSGSLGSIHNELARISDLFQLKNDVISKIEILEKIFFNYQQSRVYK